MLLGLYVNGRCHLNRKGTIFASQYVNVFVPAWYAEERFQPPPVSCANAIGFWRREKPTARVSPLR